MGKQRIFQELVKRRWKLLVLSSVLLIITFSADFAFATWVLPLLREQPWFIVITQNLTFPDETLVSNVLGSIVSGVAAIIGILLAVSLLVFQISAEKYPYRMVRYLIEEKVNAYLIDFLIITFLFSLWTLFLLKTGPTLPYISILLTLVLSTLSIVFVFVYKDYILPFFRPKQGFERVSVDVIRNLNKVFYEEETLGLSVIIYLRKVTGEHIQLMIDFNRKLIQKKDADSLYGAEALTAVLTVYIHGKRFITETSTWFPEIDVLATQNTFSLIELTQEFEEKALGKMSVPQKNDQWFEQKILSALKEGQANALKNRNSSYIVQLIQGYRSIIDKCFETQEFGVLDLTLINLKDLIVNEAFDYEGVVEIYNIAALITDKTINGFNMDELKKAFEKLTFRSSDEVSGQKLPLIFDRELMAMQKKVEFELLIEKQIITPKEEIQKELMEKIQRIDKEISQKYYDAQLTLLEAIFNRVYACSLYEEIKNVTYAEIIVIRRAIVQNKSNLIVPHTERIIRHSVQAFNILSSNKNSQNEIYNELKLGCLNCIKNRDSINFNLFFDATIQLSLTGSSNNDPENSLELIKSLAVISALSFVYSEFYKDLNIFDIAICNLLKYRNAGVWITLFRLAENIEPRWTYTSDYFNWFKDIFGEISKLPTIAKPRPPARSLDILYDHPSTFIQRCHSLMGISESIEGMVRKFTEDSGKK
jgi:hypothetical protein